MEQYLNYADMLGLTDKFSDEKLDKIINEYQDKRKEHSIEHSKHANEHDFFLKNINALISVKERRAKINVEKNYKLKSGHLMILENMNFYEDKGILKSYIPNYKNLAEIFNIENFDKNGDLLEKDQKQIDLLIDELPFAIKEIIDKYKK
jgi:hypothetical protein